MGILRDGALGGTEGHWEWHLGTRGDTLRWHENPHRWGEKWGCTGSTGMGALEEL